MKRLSLIGIPMIILLLIFAVGGCDKEKIVESTEYVHDIEYIETPGDTVFLIDTVFQDDSVTQYSTDTMYITDTVTQTNYVYDTVVQYNHIYDTVVTTQYVYDTTVTVDTVLTTQCVPNEHMAMAAMEYNTDGLVLDYMYQELGTSSGYIFYLSEFQSSITAVSTNVYDIYGYIDFWSEDWSEFYALEYYWRMTCNSGDPANMNNWTLSDPPSAVSGMTPGFRIVKKEARVLK